MSSVSNQTRPEEPSQAAYEAGRRTGLAIAALATSVVAFISLLGLEKAILACVLAALAIRGLPARSQGRRWGIAAIAVSIVYLITFAVVAAVFHDRFAELIRLLQQLG